MTCQWILQEEKYSGGSESYGKQWDIGDVVGVFLDLIDHTISKLPLVGILSKVPIRIRLIANCLENQRSYNATRSIHQLPLNEFVHLSLLFIEFICICICSCYLTRLQLISVTFTLDLLTSRLPFEQLIFHCQTSPFFGFFSSKVVNFWGFQCRNLSKFWFLICQVKNCQKLSKFWFFKVKILVFSFVSKNNCQHFGILVTIYQNFGFLRSKSVKILVFGVFWVKKVVKISVFKSKFIKTWDF